MRHPVCVVGIIMLLAAGGCGLPNRQQEAKAAAKKRFNHQKAKIKYVLGLEQFENGLIDNAAKSIQEAISIYDQDSEHFILLARIYIEQGKLAKAAEALRFISNKGPPLAEVSYVSGLLAERYGRMEEALVHRSLSCRSN